MWKVIIPVAIFFALTFATRFAHADDTTPKSPEVAVLLSAGGTALSAGVFLAGLHFESPALATAGLASTLVTPSAGQIYAGSPLTWGMGMRVLSVGITYAGFSVLGGCLGPNGHCDAEAAVTLIAMGTVGYVGGVVYDVLTAGKVAKKYNERHHVQLAPLVARTTSGPVVGVGIGGSF